MIKDVSLDQGLEGNIEMKTEPRGLVLLFPFQCNSIFVYYIKAQTKGPLALGPASPATYPGVPEILDWD